MTPADLAIAAAMPFEAKKDSMRQTQSGTWKVTFTVQAPDVPRSLTEAMPGTRYQVVIVEIGADELPVQPVKEVSPAPARQLSPKPAGARSTKRDWRDVPPTEQAGIRCGEPEFRAFLSETRPIDWREASGRYLTPDAQPAECVRLICGVVSRKEFGKDAKACEEWWKLDDQFEAWKLRERIS